MREPTAPTMLRQRVAPFVLVLEFIGVSVLLDWRFTRTARLPDVITFDVFLGLFTALVPTVAVCLISAEPSFTARTERERYLLTGRLLRFVAGRVVLWVPLMAAVLCFFQTVWPLGQKMQTALRFFILPVLLGAPAYHHLSQATSYDPRRLRAAIIALVAATLLVGVARL